MNVITQALWNLGTDCTTNIQFNRILKTCIFKLLVGTEGKYLSFSPEKVNYLEMNSLLATLVVP